MVEVLSNVSGIFPFSLYEFFMYLLALFTALFLLYIFILIINKSFRKKLYDNNIYSLKDILKYYLLNILSFLSIIYFLFIILWGLNYNRIPLEDTLIKNYTLENNIVYTYNKDVRNHNSSDLSNLYNFLIYKSNETRELVKEDSHGIMKVNRDFKDVLNRAYLGYENTVSILPQIDGNYSKPKYVLSSNLMCYTGITGIYFPFTGEANVNIAVPDIYIPSTTLHEMAHQRGYASEDEANFIGYLTAINHPDIYFKYSGYILALNHTANALYKADYKKYMSLSKKISNDVKKDLINNKNFWKIYEGKVDEISNKFNDSYLKANGIKEGSASYGKMVNLLLTYYKLYPQTHK
ncbi:DUF3810 domain-containing protein [Romboutsia lituseburensis]|uniref:DUF3810 domain-containing protein n=1 Tax=Romboutsia lituseburensis TaxID=1537 RepID=UPI00215A7078|nr:DUF3810 domain-containing protein [Romboutsia lituseburensis]MCR8744853.1 DUF3810 domain-containing protein [Romboutsia lituseburensis]